jgi:hypothetical protein
MVAGLIIKISHEDIYDFPRSSGVLSPFCNSTALVEYNKTMMIIKIQYR